MTLKNKFSIALGDDFLKAFSRIPKSHQSKIQQFINKFRSDPTSSGINYEKIQQWRDPNLRSVRIDQNYRGVVLKPESGNTYLLLWVDSHDEAYAWAKDRVFSVNPVTGALQVVRMEAIEEVISEKADALQTEDDLFHGRRDRELLRLGIPEALLPLVRSIKDDEGLESVSKYLPQEAYEALFMLAAGYSYEDTEREMNTTAVSVDVSDIEASLKLPDSQRRFYVVEDARDLAEMLNQPLAFWRVFLHPDQRRLVEKESYNGPVRVLGGAGTGKTVVAMHRARFLAQQPNSNKILLTTFTRNLADDIRHNLKKICTKAELQKIEVKNLDAWADDFLKSAGATYRFLRSNEERDVYWRRAMNLLPKEMDFSRTFIESEWKQVIQANGIEDQKEYLSVTRRGRGIRLNRLCRIKLWPVFEEYRNLLSENGCKEYVDALRDTRLLLQERGDILPYSSIIVDEAQDFTPEAFRLIRQMIPPNRSILNNDIFIVGDAHQRIYGHRFALSRCGINIVGRGKRLKVNYRTTEETRRWAVGLLEGKRIDDLDGGDDQQALYKSLLHGEAPEIQNFKTFADEIAFIVESVKKLIGSGSQPEDICIVTRTNKLLDQYQGALAANSLSVYRIESETAEAEDKKGVRLATMHRVKGIEFDYMILSAINKDQLPLSFLLKGAEDPLDREDTELRERSLLYVAATRARKKVLITSFGNPSKFL